MKKQAARPGKLLRHGTGRQQPEKQTARGSCFDMAPGDSSLKNKPPGEAASTWHPETDSLENRPPAREGTDGLIKMKIRAGSPIYD